ncbi:thioredoxin family protein [Aureispira anguillae]|uniref:Thioredoxin domain-containing protein n=1 Tax=Aureispira anguillae TaxID=2864201 RepID=A0A915YJ60_9BACT|nr:thioredoxin fold domain-containing protein [Aureispira anguillae]BDS14177.1 thioredoxin domain-containing protein [Aureispira anguillae]
MKQLLTGLILLASLQFVFASEGIHFFKGSFKEAQALAAKEHKLIFMDAYTSWCGPCKRMARDVFSAAEVGKFFNKHFINIKVDMEKGEGPRLAGKYRVSSYPTLLFLDEKGEVVHAAKGGRPADQFLGLGKVALSKNDKSGEYAKQYEEGNREPAFLRAYAYALLNSAKPNLKIANEYLKTQKELTNDENLEFLFDFANEADSKIFELAILHKTSIVALKSEADFQEKIKAACDATIDKAIEFNVASLVNEAKTKMKAANPKFAKEYSMLADIKYAAGTKDMEAYANSTDKFLKKYAKRDAKTLHQYAHTFLIKTNETKLLEKAEKWAKQATNIDFNPKYLRTHSDLLRKLGRVEEAEEVMKKANELSGEKSSFIKS